MKNLALKERKNQKLQEKENFNTYKRSELKFTSFFMKIMLFEKMLTIEIRHKR